MSVKTLSWILVSAITLGAVLLFNYWASYQLLSTLAYAGIIAALLGESNRRGPGHVSRARGVSGSAASRKEPKVPHSRYPKFPDRSDQLFEFLFASEVRY